MTEEQLLRLSSKIPGLPSVLREYNFAPKGYNFPGMNQIGLDLQTGVRNSSLVEPLPAGAKVTSGGIVEPLPADAKVIKGGILEPAEPVGTPDYKAPTLDDIVANEIKFQQELNPILASRNQQAADLALQQSKAQAAALFPYLDAAGQRATERNLRASERFRAFKEQLPSNIQAIMASKQQQMSSAAGAFAAEAQAIANQQQAATGFGQLGTGRYAGRRIA